MNQIQLEKGHALINLNAFFYPLNLVQWSSAEFKKFATVSIRKENGRVLVDLAPGKGKSAEETALHFCNYVLSLRREFGQHA